MDSLMNPLSRFFLYSFEVFCSHHGPFFIPFHPSKRKIKLKWLDAPTFYHDDDDDKLSCFIWCNCCTNWMRSKILHFICKYAKEQSSTPVLTNHGKTKFLGKGKCVCILCVLEPARAHHRPIWWNNLLRFFVWIVAHIFWLLFRLSFHY